MCNAHTKRHTETSQPLRSPPHTASFHTTLTNSQTDPSLDEFYLFQFKSDCMWCWTRSSRNQSTWHGQIKHRLHRSPGNVSKTPRHAHIAPGRHHLWFVLLNTQSREHGKRERKISRHNMFSKLLGPMRYCDGQLFLSAMLIPEASRQKQCNADDRATWWDQQVLRRSRGNSISHQCKPRFWQAD